MWQEASCDKTTRSASPCGDQGGDGRHALVGGQQHVETETVHAQVGAVVETGVGSPDRWCHRCGR